MTPLRFRDAALADLPALVAMLADDHLGALREDTSIPLDPGYAAAFEAIAADPNQRLIVAEQGGEVVGTLQLMFLPGLQRKGAWRGLVESVRIRGDRRSQGLGEAMMAWAVEASRAQGCVSVQLTTDVSRAAAHRFYERIGFTLTHKGYKRVL